MTTSTDSPTPTGNRLDEVELCLGDPNGYSGDDLTATADAVRAGEVPILRPGTTPDRPDCAVLELRIHGVGGAPADVNLEHPSTVQVSGDATAGFYRAWTPGADARKEPRREAYCWGGLNSRSASRALWLLLIAFLIINVAQWALPARRRAGDSADDPHLVLGLGIARALLRLIALLLTVAMFATVVTVLADVVAWQASGHRDNLPSWLQWFHAWGRGGTLAAALLASLLLLGVLFWTSRQTAAQYESWRSAAQPEADDRWPLTRPSFWNGARSVIRQRGCHVAAAGSYVALMGAYPAGSPVGVRTAETAIAYALLAAAVIMTASPWTDRRRVARLSDNDNTDTVCLILASGASLLAVAVAISRVWWPPTSTRPTLPYDLAFQVTILWAQLGLVIALAVVVVALRPWKQTDVIGFGLAAPLMALLACLISGIFGGAFTLTFANMLGSPSVAFGSGTPPVGHKTTLYLSSSVYAYGFGFLVTVGATLVVAGLAAGFYFIERERLGVSAQGTDDVAKVYERTMSAGPLADPSRTDDARRTVGGLWAQARLTDYAAVPLALTTVSTAAAIAAYELLELILGRDTIPGGLLVASSVGSAIALAATAYFITMLRSALRDSRTRRRIGLIWDVGTFWPRACHPFAPPCYAERAIPEVVTRIRHVVGDVRTSLDPIHARTSRVETDPAADLREQHSPLLLTGYSQGSPIAVAVAAQLPPDAVERIALLTLAAPVRRLYGRTFPAYFGPSCLAVLQERLSAPADDTNPTDTASTVTIVSAVRWRNLVRRSDYIGGWVLQNIPAGAGSAGPVDHEILDPPALWADHDPAPPPHHLHSDWFPDPQVRPYAEQLEKLV